MNSVLNLVPLVSDGIQYAHDVLDGKIIVCHWIKRACERFFDDVKHKDERGIYFDMDEGQDVLDFFSILRQFKGAWAGRPFKLEPWQIFYLINIFGWRRRDNGFRRFRKAHLYVPRKNGKTTLAAGIALYMLVADGEGAPEIYSAAIDQEQASICWEAALNLKKETPDLQDVIKDYKLSMVVPGTAGKFRPLSGESKNKDGVGASCLVMDETHKWEGRKLWEVMTKGMGARAQPLVCEISTFGDDVNSVCYENYDYCTKILTGFDVDGGFKDDWTFCLIYTVDLGDSWEDPATWRKANPNYGISVYHDFFEEQYRTAKEILTSRDEFLTKNLNIWISASARALDMTLWPLCGVKYKEDDLIGLKGYGGLDLSQKIDLTAFLVLFRPKQPGDCWRTLLKCYMPENNVEKRMKETKAPYRLWASQGFLTLTPGNVVDYEWVKKDVRDIMAKFKLQAIGFDPWNASQVCTDLLNEGFPMIELRQGYQTLSDPCKEFEAQYTDMKLAHNFNPMLHWAFSNLCWKKDPNGNYRPDKEKSGKKIDPVCALIDAFAVALKDNAEPFVYNDREVRFL